MNINVLVGAASYGGPVFPDLCIGTGDRPLLETR